MVLSWYQFSSYDLNVYKNLQYVTDVNEVRDDAIANDKNVLRKKKHIHNSNFASYKTIGP